MTPDCGEYSNRSEGWRPTPRSPGSPWPEYRQDQAPGANSEVSPSHGDPVLLRGSRHGMGASWLTPRADAQAHRALRGSVPPDGGAAFGRLPDYREIHLSRVEQDSQIASPPCRPFCRDSQTDPMRALGGCPRVAGGRSVSGGCGDPDRGRQYRATQGAHPRLSLLHDRRGCLGRRWGETRRRRSTGRPRGGRWRSTAMVMRAST